MVGIYRTMATGRNGLQRWALYLVKFGEGATARYGEQGNKGLSG